MDKIHFQNLEVLVVEDESFIRQMILQWLKDFGVPKTHSAVEGFEGVRHSQ